MFVCVIIYSECMLHGVHVLDINSMTISSINTLFVIENNRNNKTNVWGFSLLFFSCLSAFSFYLLGQ